MSDLVGNPEDRFSQNKARFIPIAIKMSPTHMPVLAEDSVNTRLCSSAKALASCQNILSINYMLFNPHVANGISYPCYLDESTFKFMGFRNELSFFFHF